MSKWFVAVMLVASCATILGCASTHSARTSRGVRSGDEAPGPLSAAQFRALMETIAQGWNEGDSMKSARCFAKDAVYMEPPDLQVYQGREALYEFFGGKDQPPAPGRMTWHHLLFDEEQQIGAGEYTYQGNRRLHGMVLVRVTSGVISHWREYQQASPMTWDDFVGKSKF